MVRTYFSKCVKNLNKSEFISEFRNKKVAEKGRTEDKLLSLTSGLLLKKSLETVEFDENDAVYEVNEFGCPEIKNIENFNFSLSHSGELSICSFSKNGVGCDVQLIEKPNFKVAKRFFHKNEFEFLERVSTDKINDFYKIWTAKEAVTKLFKMGFYMRFSAFCVTEDKFSPFIIVYDKKIYLKYFLKGEYCICVASEGENILDLEEINL